VKKLFTQKEIGQIATDVIELISKKRNSAGATVLALSGDLGAGKTTLVQAIAKELGIKKKLASPTFVLLKSYAIPNGGEWEELQHIDAYRLEDPDHIQHIRFKDLVDETGNLIIVEWPEQLGKHLPKHAHLVKLKHSKKEGMREIHF
jgi:tRNA threonylcarbamoyladenosine biosynthesis protein TsaE